MSWTYVISDFREEEIVETFYEKELQKTNQKEFRVEKVIKRKGYMLNGKATIVILIVGLVKKTKYKWANIPQNRNPPEEK